MHVHRGHRPSPAQPVSTFHSPLFLSLFLPPPQMKRFPCKFHSTSFSIGINFTLRLELFFAQGPGTKKKSYLQHGFQRKKRKYLSVHVSICNRTILEKPRKWCFLRYLPRASLLSPSPLPTHSYRIFPLPRFQCGQSRF